MPTPTYIPLANITLGSSAASVTFSSISQAYRDLVLVVSATGSAADSLRSRLNADTSTNYAVVNMTGSGSTASSSAFSGRNGFDLSVNAALSTTENLLCTVQVLDYSATDKHKPVLARTGRAGQADEALALRWASTSAVTTMSVYPNSGSFTSGSSFALYGIVA